MNSQTKKVKQPRGNPLIAELGRRARFQPGQSGNPGGRPSWTPYADAHREVAELPVADLVVLPTDSVALATAKTVASQALKGNISAAAEAANRAEGTPRRRPEVSQAVELVVTYEEPLVANRNLGQSPDLVPPSDGDSKSE